jgi:hypothetical protein
MADGGVWRRSANKLVWPPERSDIAALVCLGILIWCLGWNKSEWIAGAALLLAVFSVLSARMTGGEVSGPGFSFRGDFVEAALPPAGDEPPQLTGDKARDPDATPLPEAPALEPHSPDAPQASGSAPSTELGGD